MNLKIHPIDEMLEKLGYPMPTATPTQVQAQTQADVLPLVQVAVSNPSLPATIHISSMGIDVPINTVGAEATIAAVMQKALTDAAMAVENHAPMGPAAMAVHNALSAASGEPQPPEPPPPPSMAQASDITNAVSACGPPPVLEETETVPTFGTPPQGLPVPEGTRGTPHLSLVPALPRLPIVASQQMIFPNIQPPVAPMNQPASSPNPQTPAAPETDFTAPYVLAQLASAMTADQVTYLGALLGKFPGKYWVYLTIAGKTVKMAAKYLCDPTPVFLSYFRKGFPNAQIDAFDEEGKSRGRVTF